MIASTDGLLPSSSCRETSENPETVCGRTVTVVYTGSVSVGLVPSATVVPVAGVVAIGIVHGNGPDHGTWRSCAATRRRRWRIGANCSASHTGGTRPTPPPTVVPSTSRRCVGLLRMAFVWRGRRLAGGVLYNLLYAELKAHEA